ncbi:MAG: hypothetical protein JWP29_4818 [Rhodoferax sp.]|nr:hypothetical protein [Rhodoferax sp.]
MNEAGTDRQVIHVDQDFEREGWAAAFGVTVAELLAAVKIVGNSVPAVRAYLHKPEGSATMF